MRQASQSCMPPAAALQPTHQRGSPGARTCEAASPHEHAQQRLLGTPGRIERPQVGRGIEEPERCLKLLFLRLCLRLRLPAGCRAWHIDRLLLLCVPCGAADSQSSAHRRCTQAPRPPPNCYNLLTLRAHDHSWPRSVSLSHN